MNEISPRSKLMDALAQSDEMRRSDRADRIQWLSEHNVSLGIVMGPMDSMAIRSEASECFAEGHYIATLLLAVAFIEHAITDSLIERGLAKYGIPLAKAIRIAREKRIFPPEMLSGADHLRELRNPFTHRKEPTHDHSFGNRFLKSRAHPRVILEKDAKDALIHMYAFFHATLKSG